MSSSTAVRNEYLEKVQAQQLRVADDLRGGLRMKMRAAPAEPGAEPAAAGGAFMPGAAGAGPVDVRVSGFWRWKSVVVPPNAYVVHTRRGHAQPLHLGLGVSFGFDPARDAYLVVPAALQTLLLSAPCICRERQGLFVQGYVQWIIEDFATAYRKLDFSDPQDPMRIVNVQLREQAEAAIKDVVATMGIDEALSDRQPVIQELTARLRALAEGVGLRIVTVQVKEAVVSSPAVWELLQRPFRAERAREARLAELTHQAAVQAREAEAEKASAAERIATASEVARLEAQAAATRFDREQGERVRRARAEAETLEQAAVHERSKAEREAELARLRIEHEILEAGLRFEAESRREEKRITLDAARRKVENEISPEGLQARLIGALPEIAGKLPHPKELRSIQLGGLDALGGLLAGIREALGPRP
jgi:regulator of protease activity HflC (stomatin/prohibitin superfamily)